VASTATPRTPGTPASVASSAVPTSPASTNEGSELYAAEASDRSARSSESRKRLTAVETEVAASRPRIGRKMSGDDDDGSYRPQYVVWCGVWTPRRASGEFGVLGARPGRRSARPDARLRPRAWTTS